MAFFALVVSLTTVGGAGVEPLAQVVAKFACMLKVNDSLYLSLNHAEKEVLLALRESVLTIRDFRYVQSTSVQRSMA